MVDYREGDEEGDLGIEGGTFSSGSSGGLSPVAIGGICAVVLAAALCLITGVIVLMRRGGSFCGGEDALEEEDQVKAAMVRAF